jgi:hypothetical protein
MIFFEICVKYNQFNYSYNLKMTKQHFENLRMNQINNFITGINDIDACEKQYDFETKNVQTQKKQRINDMYDSTYITKFFKSFTSKLVANLKSTLLEIPYDTSETTLQSFYKMKSTRMGSPSNHTIQDISFKSRHSNVIPFKSNEIEPCDSNDIRPCDSLDQSFYFINDKHETINTPITLKNHVFSNASTSFSY